MILILIAIAPAYVYGTSQNQSKQLTCVVTDKSGPLPGASVFVKGTQNGAVTGNDGKATLFNVESNDVIVVSFIGYSDAEVPVKGRSVIEVNMAEDLLALSEIVVVGYGTQKKANLTGAVDQVGAEVFEGRPNANVTQMLQGQIPNLNLKFTDGRPNSSPSYNIRGKTSIGQGGSALVLIDGVEGDPSLLNPNDIESVSVLKDASSAAIYGSRAPYGVVLITTKDASKGKTKITYQTNLTLQTPTSVPDYVSDGYTWADHFHTAYYNYNFTNPSGINKTMEFSTAWLEEYRKRAESGDYEILVSDGSIGSKGRWLYFIKGVDYVDEMYKDYSFSQTHNVSISGSDKKFDYYVSGRFFKNNGIFDSDVNPESYKMLNSRIKVGYQIYDWLKIINNTEITYTKYVMPQTYSESNGNIWRNIADEGHPCSPIWNPDGTLTHSAVYSVGDLLYGKSHRKYVKKQVQTTFAAKASFLDDKLHLNADFTYRNRDFNTTVKKVKSEFSRFEGVIETITGTQSYLSETLRNYEYLANNEYAEYEDTFAEKHYLKVLLGYNYETQTYKQTYGYNDDLLTPDVDNINLAMGIDNKQVTGDFYRWKNVGFFGRINYVFDERYLLELDGRYDGSSKFPDNQRWDFFPSASIGWRVSQEHWFPVSHDLISNLKFRASYGSLGNSNVGNYAYTETFGFSNGRLINGNIVRYTSAPSPIPESLTWETARTFDVGMDLSMFKGRLSVTADYYRRKTLDMYTIGPTLPDVYGASSPKGNYAEMTTKGYEISISWNDSFNVAGKPLHYGLKASLVDYYSIIDKYNNATKSLSTACYNTSYYEGMKLGEIWGFVSNGLWQNQEDIDAAEAKAVIAGQKYYNPLMQTSKTYKLYPGDIKFEDLNGNGYIDRGSNTVDDPGDRKIIGNSEPRYIYSFGLDLDWNNITFSAFFQGVGKQDWYPTNDASSFWGQYNRPYNQMPKWHVGNYWTEDNPDAYLPRYTGYYAPFYKGTNCANTRYLQNAAYIRLKTLQVGYTLPTKWTSKIFISKVNIFFAGENLWTWSPVYRHTRDVDVTANIYGTDSVLSTTGDGYNYPTMRSYSLGINISF